METGQFLFSSSVTPEEITDMKAQKCPMCDKGSLKKEIVTELFEYKGKTIEIPDYIKYRCDVCGEAIVDNNTIRKSGKILKEFKRRVDGLLTAEQIKAIRLKLGLTQAELAEIVGGGAKSLARYESGKVCQSRGMDNLLRILDAYPHTLNLIHKKENPGGSSMGQVVHMDDHKARKAYTMKTEANEFIAETPEIAYGS